MKKLVLICAISLFGNLVSVAQVTKTDATPATLDAAIATRNFVFTGGDFGGCTSLLEVEVDLTLTVTDNPFCNAGGYGVHNDIAVSLTSPSGTTVHLVQDFTGILIGSPPILITYNDASYPTIVNETATYDDDAVLLADNQTSFGAGLWKPHNPLSAFDGENPAGTWVLKVADGRNQFGADYTCYINSAVRITCGVACTNPDVPSALSASAPAICPSGSSTLSWTGALNDATAWQVYSGSCGGTLVGTTTSNSFVVSPSSTTTYFIRGEDGAGCVDESTGLCGSVAVTVNSLDNASFNYSAAAYCVNDADPSPTITGLAGGTFSSTAGLSINASSGVIDVSASTPGTYTVTYTTSGTCPNSSGVSVTINALDNASFNYSAAAYCSTDSDPTPTITGLAGGTFSSTAGLSINASTGTVDVSTSTPGTYTVTYITSGSCPNSSAVSVTINALDNASFNYSAAAYCVNDSDPTPTITGLAGGTFTSTAGLSVNAGTGTIDVSASTPGTYTVTYTTSGSCPNSSAVSVTINALDNASFNYSAAAYCVNDSDPTPTITGLAGGTFTSTAGLSVNAGTGTIDVSASTPGTYTVTYTTSGSCPNSSAVSVTINAIDDASFNYSAAAYCANDSDPTPTITGLAGGTFSSTAGLAINASTGAIDVSVSTPGTYTVTYITSGSCPNSSAVSVTINALDNASFNYSAAAYCVNDSDPTPTITGLAGGTFTSTAGLSVNAGTGTIDVSVSTPGTYTVTYTTSGSCPNSSAVSVTINAIDDASFNYSTAAYCSNDSDPTPTITGLAGGTFLSTAGLTINTSTGAIDVSVSTPGTYTVTYTTSGSCPNSSAVSVTINAIDDASFNYSAAAYCVNDSDPTPTITGLAGGTFTSTAGLSVNAGTGTIDVSASTPGTYTVTYTTSGTCPNSSGVSVTINALDDASFSYSASNYCPSASDPTPTVTGLAGGTFLSTAGLTINTSTGAIDVSASTPGTYTVTYTTSGTCPNSSGITVTIGDAIDPIITCPSNVSVSADGGSCAATSVSLGTPATSDNCIVASVTNDAPASFPIGNTTVTWTVTDGSGNTATCAQIVTVTDNEDPVITGCPTDITVAASASGCTALVSWTAPGFTDNCVGGSISGTATPGDSFSEGTTLVTYTATDGSGNTATCIFNVTVTNDLSVTVDSSDDPLCAGSSDGQIFVTVSGGTAGYSFDWDHDGTGDFDDAEDQGGLSDGTYSLTVQDANGCEATTSSTITEPSALVVSIDSEIDPSACGVTDGAINISVSGGTPGYTFDWDNDGTGDFDDSEDLSAVGAGTYNIVVMDNNGCTIAGVGNLSDPSGPSISLDATVDNICFGDTLGQISTTISGGASPYIIDWDNDGTGDADDSEDIINLAAGTYNLLVEDAAGCIVSLSATVNEPAEVVTSEAASICANDSLFVGGAYQNTAGIYKDTLTNLIGCDSIIETTLTIDPVFEDVLTPITICTGDSILIYGNYEMVAGLYYDSLSTMLGCDSVEIQELIINDVDITVTVASGDYTANSSGAGITYQWIDCSDNSLIAGETNQAFTPSQDGSYAVIIDDNGCIDTSDCVQIDGVGIDSFESMMVQIFPNPSYGTFNVVLSSIDESVQLIVTDLSGRTIISQEMTDKQVQLDLSAFEDGVYLLNLVSDNLKTKIKLVKN